MSVVVLLLLLLLVLLLLLLLLLVVVVVVAVAVDLSVGCVVLTCRMQPIDDPEEEDIVQAHWSAAQPLVPVGRLCEPPPPGTYTDADVNNTDRSDLVLYVGPAEDALKPLHLHKDVLAAHSVIVAGMLSTQR